MATNYYLPEDNAPLPPKHADVLTTCCDYCVVACGYKVYRWPVGSGNGGRKANQNAFGIDFPSSALRDWVAPAQHNVVMYKGRPHNVVITPDKATKVVNTNGDSSMRGGLIAQKCYNPKTPTRDRLTSPMLRIYGMLQPVDWDLALDVAAAIGRHVIARHGESAYAIKTYSYQFIENTYAITKFGLRHINTPAFAFHDNPGTPTSTPGFRDAGFDNFGPSYDDWGGADVLMCAGTDPYETKTIIFTQHIKPAVERGMKLIMLNPRETAGVAYAKKMGGLHIQLDPGSDALVLGAITRVILEQGWEDRDWIDNWVNDKWGSNSGFGQGTRNTPWQWRTTWGKFQTKGFDDYKKWLLSKDEYRAEFAAKAARIPVAQIHRAAEMLAKPHGGKRPKASFGVEKGLYWTNNTGATNAIASLATTCGAGGRPGQVIGRFGGHQRGGQKGGRYPREKSAEKVPGRRKRPLDVDRWLVSGHVRLAHVIGTTWIQSMAGSQGLAERFRELVVANPNQVQSLDKQEIIDTLKRRADSGGMVVINQEIYPRDPITTQFADIVFPAATWGEEDYIRANGERRLRVYQKFYDAPGDAKPDWWIIAGMAKRMGYDGFDWKNTNEVAEEAARFSRKGRKAFNMILVAARREGKTLHKKLAEFGTDGIQGPTFYNYQTGELFGTKRLHDTTLTAQELARKGLADGPQGKNIESKLITHFKSQTGKVNIQKHPWELYADFWEWQHPKGDEVWFSNGRINEVWQSGFDDVERRPYTTQRWPENWIEIHPEDAKARGIESGDRVMLYSNRVPAFKDTIIGIHGNDLQFDELLKNGHIRLLKAAVTAIAIVTPAVKQGVVYGDMLDMRQPTNSLAPRVTDNISNNYNYKLGVCRVKRMGGSEYQNGFRSFSFAPRNIVV